MYLKKIAAVKAYKKAGFKITGKDDKNELKINITKDAFLKHGGNYEHNRKC